MLSLLVVSIFFIYCCRPCIYLWMFVCLRLLYVSIFIYLFLICLRTCVWLRISVYSIRRSMYLTFFIPHVLQRKFRCGLCTLGKNFFLYKLFKFCVSLNRYHHCTLLLSYLKSGLELLWIWIWKYCLCLARWSNKKHINL